MTDDVATALTALVAAIREQVRHELRAEMSVAAPAPDESQGPLLLSLPEAREKLRVSKATLDRLLRQERLRKVKIGSRAFVAATEIERFIAEASAD